MDGKFVPGTADAVLFTPEMVRSLVQLEMTHRTQQGYELGDLPEQIEAADLDVERLWKLYGALLECEISPEYPYQEPNDLESIKKLRPDGPRVMPNLLSDPQLEDRMLGALQGRVVGVILGRPVEGDSKTEIRRRLESTGEYPLSDYFGQFWIDDGVRKVNPHGTFKSTREGLQLYRSAEADDDINYVLLNLRLIEKFGPQFTTEHVGYNWLRSIPINWTWGPERTAYINLSRYTDIGALRWRRTEPDELWRVTHHLNESSELIGAQIRAEAFGYCAPGLPELAAEWGYRDAALTHVKNGIYGEMLFAAIISAAFVAPDIRSSIEIGLTEIPKNCRLAEAVRNTIAWWDELRDWEEVWARIEASYKQYTTAGTINNACFIVNALLAGGGDFERTLCITVMQGRDTDCTAGTAGSIIGAFLGAGNVPEKWTSPLNDTMDSAVQGDGHCRITEVANRLFNVARTIGKSGRHIPYHLQQ